MEDQGLSTGVSTLLSPLSYPDSLEEEQVETQPVLPGGFENKGDRVRLQVPQPNQWEGVQTQSRARANASALSYNTLGQVFNQLQLSLTSVSEAELLSQSQRGQEEQTSQQHTN